MVIGMVTKKITITLGEDQVQRIRALVEKGTASSISGFVQHAVSTALDEDDSFAAMLAEALEATGGPATPEEIAWAHDVLGVPLPSQDQNA